MKNLFLFLMLSLLVSCKQANLPKYTNYSIDTEEIILSENKEKATIFIENLVSKSNFHMTGGDYEDPEDVINQAQQTALEMYGTKVLGLSVDINDDGFSDKFIPTTEFSKKDSIIYNYLKSRLDKETNSLN